MIEIIISAAKYQWLWLNRHIKAQNGRIGLVRQYARRNNAVRRPIKYPASSSALTLPRQRRNGIMSESIFLAKYRLPENDLMVCFSCRMTRRCYITAARGRYNIISLDVIIQFLSENIK